MHNSLVLCLQFLVLNMSEFPIHRIVQISNAAGELSADVIERGRRVEVRAHESVRVNSPVLRIIAIENVAAEAGNRLAVYNLSRARSRLRILACYAPNANDGF